MPHVKLQLDFLEISKMRLTEYSLEQEPLSAVVYGPPKSGKTFSIVKGLAHKFKVLYVDFEKGVSTLAKLPANLKENVEVIRVFDTKDEPNAISTALLLASGKTTSICEAHGKSKCIQCKTKKAPMATVALNDLDPAEWVVVFDSFTQITSSAQGHVCRKLNLEVDKMTFDHWRAQGVLLERFLDYLQNARFNCVLITHEMGIDQSDGVEKLQPSGGSKNFARNVPKYFDHIVYLTVKNRKHKAISSTTAENRILSGSRTDIEVELDNPDTICALFGK